MFKEEDLGTTLVLAKALTHHIEYETLNRLQSSFKNFKSDKIYSISDEYSMFSLTGCIDVLKSIRYVNLFVLYSQTFIKFIIEGRHPETQRNIASP